MEYPQQQGTPESEEQEEFQFHQCFYHPGVETGLGCGRCGRYICPKCVIPTQVGARCNECARVGKVPTYDVQPTYYVRASIAGGLTGLAAGILWGILLGLHIPFVTWLLAVGVGYVVGEAISTSVNRKRGQGLAIVAGASMGLAVLVSGFLPSLSNPISGLFWLLIVGYAFYVAINRVR
jgi:hypothetical protein